HPNTFIVFPWGPSSLTNRDDDPFVPLILASRALFGMAGLVHYDDFLANAPPGSRWRKAQDHLVRINMGCDASLLPCRKPDAPRPTGLLHVSSLRRYKKPELMLESLPAEGCDLYIGTKRMDIIAELAAKGLMKRNVHVLGAIDNADPGANRFILEKCAYYLHTSGEAQATTILENCARGLVPLLTPRSGFSSPDVIFLTENPEENQEIIRGALAMSDEEYAARSRNLRQHVRQYHSWDRICQYMYVTIRALMAGQDVDRRGEEYS
ncbi:MAG: glycosyltransferase, partial [Caldilineaceae bacterium]|nr:glycosyltransferase [Caldilineaceae bacterium]